MGHARLAVIAPSGSMAATWQTVAFERAAAKGSNRCLAVIETRVAKWEVGGLFPNWT